VLLDLFHQLEEVVSASLFCPVAAGTPSAPKANDVYEDYETDERVAL
jgi:hypothetical protein